MQKITNAAGTVTAAAIYPRGRAIKQRLEQK